MGENGSGKTSGSGKLLAMKYFKAGFGGLVLCFKTEEADTWRSYLKACGRESDGRFFGVGEAFTFNFMDYEAKTSGIDFAENLVTLLIDIASIQRRAEATASDADYWIPQKKRLLRNAITLLMLTGESIQLRTLYKMIVSAPKDPSQVLSPDWKQDSFLYKLLERAEQKSNHSEWEPTRDYWLEGRPHLPSKTRETIDSDFTGMFDPLTRGKIGELFGTTTNLTPDNIFDGKVVVVDLPVAKYREIGQHAALIWAQLFQRAVDRRDYKHRTPGQCSFGKTRHTISQQPDFRKRSGRGFVSSNGIHRILSHSWASFGLLEPKTLVDLGATQVWKAAADIIRQAAISAIESTQSVGALVFRPRGPTGSDLQWACVGHDAIMAAVAAGSPLARKAKIDLKDLEPMFFVGMSEKAYPGSNEWLIETCRGAGFTPRILQDADREPAVISFVAAGLGVAFCCRNRLKGSLTKA
jgi:hypothetical protein